MPKIFVSKAIQIDQKPAAVFEKINDFHHWSKWSPWSILEEGVKLDVQKDGKAYGWIGKRTGSGNMKITNEKENESIEMDLKFIKPFKSFAKVGFTIQPSGEGTSVTWTMENSLPFFLFWMKNLMVAGIGMDFDRGLKMLKNYVEDGVVQSKLEVKNESNYAGCSYVGLTGTTAISEMQNEMGDKMKKLFKFSQENEALTTGEVITIYHKWDIAKAEVAFTVALGVKESLKDLDDEFVSGVIPRSKVKIVKHTGAYEHLGNPWSMLQMMTRNKEIKANKKIDPFEVYVNSPADTRPEDLITEVIYPIK